MALLKRELYRQVKGPETTRADRCTLVFDTDSKRLYVEREVAQLSGIKSLYSESFFPRDEFDRIYGGEAYRALKAKYDPGNALPDLYAKCVLRQ